jgi:pentatricopeptide repeat protein
VCHLLADKLRVSHVSVSVPTRLASCMPALLAWPALCPARRPPPLASCSGNLAATCHLTDPCHPTDPATNLQAAGLQPDVYTYTSLISGCASGKQAGLARELWRQMIERGIRPTIVTHNAMLKVWDGSGRLWA